MFSNQTKLVFVDILFRCVLASIYAVCAVFFILYLAVLDGVFMDVAEKALTDVVDMPEEMLKEMEVGCALGNGTFGVAAARTCETLTKVAVMLVDPLLSQPAYHLRNMFIEIKAGVWGTDMCYI